MFICGLVGAFGNFGGVIFCPLFQDADGSGTRLVEIVDTMCMAVNALLIAILGSQSSS